MYLKEIELLLLLLQDQIVSIDMHCKGAHTPRAVLASSRQAGRQAVFGKHGNPME